MTNYTQALWAARELAMTRISHEAARLGPDGVCNQLSTVGPGRNKLLTVTSSDTESRLTDADLDWIFDHRGIREVVLGLSRATRLRPSG
jgi:hypothetical protein